MWAKENKKQEALCYQNPKYATKIQARRQHDASIKSSMQKPGLAVWACDLHTHEAAVERSRVQGRPRVHTEFKIALEYKTLYLKTKQKKQFPLKQNMHVCLCTYVHTHTHIYTQHTHKQRTQKGTSVFIVNSSLTKAENSQRRQNCLFKNGARKMGYRCAEERGWTPSLCTYKINSR